MNGVIQRSIFIVKKRFFFPIIALIVGIFSLNTLSASANGILDTSVHQSAQSPICSKTGCDHTDPYKTNCAGPGASYYVVASAPIIILYNKRRVGYVQLWYSNTCGTNW